MKAGLDYGCRLFYYSYQCNVDSAQMHGGAVGGTIGTIIMVLSQKSQYAVRAVFELAKRHGRGPVSAGRIAEAQYIPVRFLENILAQLRQAGIVESVRGKEGGYRLLRNPRDVSVGEVVRMIQGPLHAVDCADTTAGPGDPRADDSRNRRAVDRPACFLRPGCVLLPMWDKAHSAMMNVFDSTSFQDLLDQERAASEQEPLNYVI